MSAATTSSTSDITPHSDCAPMVNESGDSLPRRRLTSVKLFVCSTGRDMQHEQNTLFGPVFYRLRDHCRNKYGFEFHGIDLRWATSTSLAPDDHLMQRICMSAIEECRSESPGLRFIALVGQLYGERPLPAFIRTNDYDLIRMVVNRRRSRDAKCLLPILDSCYQLDCNELAPGHYRRIAQSQLMKQVDEETLEELKGLVWLGVNTCIEEGLITMEEAAGYIRSDLDLQCRHGLQAARDCLVFRRTIIDLRNHVNLPLVKDRFANTAPCSDDPCRMQLDVESERCLDILINEVLPAAVHPCDVISRSVLWRHDDGVSDRLHPDYFNEMCSTILAKMTSMIDDALGRHADENPQGANEVDGLDSEIDQHWTWAKVAVDGFQGHEEVLELIHSYVISTELKPLVVFGDTGVGKTSLIARAAFEATNWIDNGSLVNIVRFVNATLMSRDVRHLLSTICAQLCSAIEQSGHVLPSSDVTKISANFASYYSCSYCDLVHIFHCLLGLFPQELNVVVFIDGVDLLFSDGDQSASLDWIPQSVAEHVKLVLSVANGDQLLKPLRTDVIKNKNNFVEVMKSDISECTNMLINELAVRYNRCLTQDQLCRVTKKCFTSGGTPFLVKLVAALVRTWTSYEVNLEQLVECLPTTVDEAIDRVLERIEVCFGRPLVARVLALLMTSELGLSDTEMDDVLSLDDVVFDALPDRGSRLPLRRMPSLVWYGIKYLLVEYGLLSTVYCHRVLVNNWRHERVQRRVSMRYLQSSDVSRHCHSILADYWLGRWAGVGKPITRPGDSVMTSGGGSDRYVPRQPLMFDCATQSDLPRYNLRKFDRLPVHLQRSGRHDELNNEVLFNFDWIYHKAAAFSYDAVIDDYRLSCDVDVRLVETALRQSQPYIGACRQNIGIELTGRLLPYIGVHQNVRRLIYDCDRRGLELSAILPNFSYRRPPGGPLETTVELATNSECGRTASHPALQFALVGGGHCRQLILAKDPSRPVIHVIDPITGHRKSDIVTSIGDLHVSSSGKLAAIAEFDREKSVKLHSLDLSDSFPDKTFFLGHLIPSKYLELSSRDKLRLTKTCIVGDSHIVFGVESSVDTRSWLVVGSFVSGSIMSLTQHRGHITCCQSWKPETRGVVYVGNGPTLCAYNVVPDIRLINEICLQDTVRLIAFTKNGRYGFVAGDRTDSITLLTINVSTCDPVTGSNSNAEGGIEAQSEIGIMDALIPPVAPANEPICGTDNSIRDMEVSNSDELLLIRGRLAVVIYHICRKQIVKVIQRPDDVPVEFRLPHSKGSFTEVDITQAHFTADSKFIVVSIFRDIYVWSVDDAPSNLFASSFMSRDVRDAPIATLRAPIGIVSDLFVTFGGDTVQQDKIISVIGSDSPSSLFDIWNIGVAMTTPKAAVVASSRDRLTSSISNVTLTRNDARAFIQTTGSDEIGVYDMSSGQIVDLMTHEGVVAGCSITSSGRYMIVSLEHAKPGQFNKIWNTECRQMIHEFGDIGVYSVPMTMCEGFFVVGQSSCSVSDPYHVTLYQITDNNKVDEIQLDFDLCYVLDVPFLTPYDRYLVVFHATDYEQSTAHYIHPQICAIALQSQSQSSTSPDSAGCVSRTTYSPADLQSRVPTIKRFLHVRPCPTNSYNVVVLYTNESDRVGGVRGITGRGSRTAGVPSSDKEGIRTRYCNTGESTIQPGGYEHNFGFLIMDVCSGVVCQVIEDCFPPYTDLNRLLSTTNHRLYVDQKSNIYNMATGNCVAESVFQCDNINLHQFALHDQVLIGTDTAGYLHCCRLSDGQLIARVYVHGQVTALRVCHDSRTVMVGCSDGTVLSYLIIDLLTDADKYDGIISSLGTRQVSNIDYHRVGSGAPTIRAWDKVDHASGTAPNYSRPPSAIMPIGCFDKTILSQLRPDKSLSAHQRQATGVGTRSASSSQLYRLSDTCRSQTCNVM